MRVYDQDSEERVHKLSRRGRVRAVQIVVLAALASIVLAVAAVEAFASNDRIRPGCRYVIERGDTLWELSQRFTVEVDELQSVNGIVDRDLIIEGASIDRCPASTIHGGSPSLSAPTPEMPAQAIEWAAAVTATRPAWATDSDIRLLVALAGPESGFCEHSWNLGDASADGKWIGSLGCVQIRILACPQCYPGEEFRSASLADSLPDQARAAWRIYRQQGRTAWGPARPGRQLKLTESCEGTQDRTACLRYWAIADAALVAGGGVMV